ncbi:MAG TPA: hypothetical protein VIO16_08615, partial [Dehalococcoidia bacterium]
VWTQELAAMMGYGSIRYPRPATAVAPISRRNRFDGFQFSLLAPPSPGAATRRLDSSLPHTIRAVAPSLRPLMARTGNRCPECDGPLVNGEACVACPVCGFRRQGR